MTTPSMLPQNVKPELYDITLIPNLDNFTFTGEEIIDISISKPTTDLADPFPISPSSEIIIVGFLYFSIILAAIIPIIP